MSYCAASRMQSRRKLLCFWRDETQRVHQQLSSLSTQTDDELAPLTSVRCNREDIGVRDPDRIAHSRQSTGKPYAHNYSVCRGYQCISITHMAFSIPWNENAEAYHAMCYWCWCLRESRFRLCRCKGFSSNLLEARCIILEMDCIP